jgi:hypothetical protein
MPDPCTGSKETSMFTPSFAERANKEAASNGSPPRHKMPFNQPWLPATAAGGHTPANRRQILTGRKPGPFGGGLSHSWLLAENMAEAELSMHRLRVRAWRRRHDSQRLTWNWRNPSGVQ